MFRNKLKNDFVYKKNTVRRLISIILSICVMVTMIYVPGIEIKADTVESDSENKNQDEVIMDELSKAIPKFLNNPDVYMEVLPKGSEIHPHTTGTADYVEEIHSCYIAITGNKVGDVASSNEAMMIKLVRINNITKSDEIASKFSEWEFCQQFPCQIYQYHDGKYIIFASIPNKYIEMGFTFDKAKECFDKAYDTAIKKIAIAEKIDEISFLKEISNFLKNTFKQITFWFDSLL